ncbi:hypothetical protein X777_10884, partial [Ooceraea biroi]
QMVDIKEVMKKASYICTTADIWTAANRRFMGVTVHWICQKTLERKSAAIVCRRFLGSHTWRNIGDLLMEINSSFGVNHEKIVSTVTDNGSNFVKAFRELGITDTCYIAEGRNIHKPPFNIL